MVKIALLATGDEVVEGEILNLNSQKIAQLFTDKGYEIGLHVSCRDDHSVMANTLKQLQASHQITVITGGLGPTDDDRTRFVLADLTEQPLVFHEPSWQWIIDRYSRINKTIPDINRRQALFPENATVLPNENGSADGCIIKHNGHVFVMLPGPPNECLPIVRNDLLEHIQAYFKPNYPPLTCWRLFGISESQLAQELNEAFPGIKDEIGYRWHYPYIDVKYRGHLSNNIDKNKSNLALYLKKYEICPATTTARDMLYQWLLDKQPSLNIIDQVTGGVLQTYLQTPQLAKSIGFNNYETKQIQIKLTGLESYWQQSQQPKMQVLMEITNNGQQWKKRYTIENRPLKLTVYVAELLAIELLKYFEEFADVS